MDLAAQYVSCQQDVQAEFMKICAMKSDSKKLINSERLENELEINPETDTVCRFISLTHDPISRRSLLPFKTGEER